MEMRRGKNLSVFLIASLCFYSLTGCFPNEKYVLTNDSTIAKLNERMKEKFVRIKTNTCIVEGEGLLVKRDSSFITTGPGLPRTISISDIREIRYSSDSKTEGVVELNNKKSLDAVNIHNSDNDTVTTFDEKLPSPFGFPTKDLTLIQYKSKNGEAMQGIGIGVISGIAVGSAAGYLASRGYPHGEFDPRPYIIAEGCCIGGGVGALTGFFIGARTDKWEDVDIVVKFDEGLNQLKE
jgi:hypothetical protein